MKIAILTKNYHRKLIDVGDINAKALSKGLKKLGHDVEIVAFNKSGSSNVNVVSLWEGFLKNYDRIYASSPQRYFGPLCIIFSFVHLRPLYISIFGSTLAPVTENRIGKEIFKLLLKLKLIVLLSTSKYQKRFYKRVFRVTTPLLLPCVLSFGYNKTKVKRGAPKLLFIGSGENEGRGIESVFEVANNLLKKYPKLILRVLNKHGETKKARALVGAHKLRKNVELVGYVGDMSKEYNKAWVNIIPFKRLRYIPPIPFSFIEAQSFGTPTITTKKPQFGEIIPKENMISETDTKKLEKRILKLIQNKNKTSVSVDYFPEEVCKKFIEILGL